MTEEHNYISMEVVLTQIKCENCKEELIITGKYNERLDEVIRCPNCNFPGSGSCYEFIKELNEEDIDEILNAPCCCCDNCDDCSK
jgi:hypothetical protein